MRYFIIAAFVLVAVATGYGQNKTTIEGILEIANDMFVIVTDEPIATREFNQTVSSNRVMLICPSGEPSKIRKLVGKRVRTTGICGPAHTRYHTEPLIIVTDTLPQVVKTAGTPLPRSQQSGKATTPAPGSVLRTALMDAIRADDFYSSRSAAQANAQNILFKVAFLKVNGGWAMANVIPLKNGKAVAEPRWCLLQKDDTGTWNVVDYYRLITKYYKDDADFFSALDMDKRAVSNLRRELPEVPSDIFP